MTLLLMALAVHVDGVKVATPGILALSAAKIPARLEPFGVARSDGKRPDEFQWFPGKRGNTLCGMLHAETPWHHHISPLLKVAQDW